MDLFRSLAVRYCVFFVTVALARAATIPAFTIEVQTAVPSNDGFVLGWEFTTTEPVVVTMLGVYDDHSNGLVDPHVVGVWTSEGNLLASLTVPAGTNDQLINQFRYVPVATGALILPAGQTFDIGAVYDTGNDLVAGIHGFTNFETASSIVFQKATYAASPSLAFPNESIYTLPGYFGPNFLISTGPAVPEPVSLNLMFTGVAVLGGTAFRSLRPSK